MIRSKLLFLKIRFKIHSKLQLNLLRTFQAILVVLLVESCSDKYPEHPNYRLSAEQYGYYAKTYKDGSIGEQFGLKFKLTSNYDTLPAIYLMTCSWPENTIIDNEKIHLGTGCDRNFLYFTTIKTDEYLELTTIAQPDRFSKEYDLTSSKFRVALIAIDTTEMDLGFYLMNPNAERFLDSLKLQKERYIWSNEIQLERLEANEPMAFGKWELKKTE